jgi:hypothetical protein
MIRCSYSKSIQDVSKCGMSKIWINRTGLNAEIGRIYKFQSDFCKAEAGMKRFYLEHESNYKPNPIESAITSFNYISKSLI